MVSYLDQIILYKQKMIKISDSNLISITSSRSSNVPVLFYPLFLYSQNKAKTHIQEKNKMKQKQEKMFANVCELAYKIQKINIKLPLSCYYVPIVLCGDPIQ